MRFLVPLLAAVFTSALTAASWDNPGMANPILPGYFADPTVLEHEGTYYLYATLEPWGGETLGCWESRDFKQWTYRDLNWPTKQACTSPTSKGAMVWAPSVVRGHDGRFFMYVSVGSEIWAGVAEHPLGPWRNALGDRPLVGADFDPTYHMIDADAFIDDDGRAYLYWGSGWNWVNGACFAVELGKDMTTFVGEVKVVTPSNYFEGPTMLKHAGRYYLTYSNGKTISDTYEVRYAVSDHPLGPFVEASTSPILRTAHERHIVSPGHHGFFRQGGQTYILYHRHRIPFVEGSAFRQVCIDELNFTGDGLIEPVVATHRGPELVHRRLRERENLADPRSGARVAASTFADEFVNAERAFDDNFATRWAPAADAPGGWLQVDLGTRRRITASDLRLEYAWKAYPLTLEVSDDGSTWRTVLDARTRPVRGSPIMVPHEVDARYLRLVFPDALRGADIGVIEWIVR